MDWCGRPCLRDPHKSNALLFHPDGREKTLKERGLGWDDPPLKPSALQTSNLRLMKLRQLRLVVPKEAVPKQPVPKGAVPKPIVTGVKRKGGRPLVGDRPMTSAERKRRARAQRKAAKAGS
jgi:hypothetical protein